MSTATIETPETQGNSLTPEIQFRDMPDGAGQFAFAGKAREYLQGIMDKTGKSADEAFNMAMAHFLGTESGETMPALELAELRHKAERWDVIDAQRNEREEEKNKVKALIEGMEVIMTIETSELFQCVARDTDGDLVIVANNGVQKASLRETAEWFSDMTAAAENLWAEPVQFRGGMSGWLREVAEHVKD